MKLVSLHVVNFGCLSGFDYSFDDKLNSIYQINGYGKTTMTAFIKAMLYGINDRGRNEETNARLKYAPWNQHAFGGTLVFEDNGHQYKIERSFNPKKAGDDVFKVYDLETNSVTDKYSSNIGEELFNVNEESFTRSIFIPQASNAVEFNGDISAKLSNLVGGTNDSSSFEAAYSLLEAKKKNINSRGKGVLPDKKAELSNVLDEIAECERLMNGISEINNTVEDLDGDEAKLNAERDSLQEKIKEYKLIQDKKARYYISIEKEKEIKEIDSAIEDLNKPLKNVTEADISACKERLNEYEILARRIDDLSNDSEKNNNDKYNKMFRDGVPSNDEITSINEKIRLYYERKRGNGPEKYNVSNLSMIFIVISSIILAGGGACIALGLLKLANVLALGIGLAFVGVVGLILSIFAKISSNKKRDEALYAEMSTRVEVLESDIREFFGRYGFYNNDFSNNLITLCTYMSDYENKKGNISNNDLKISSVKKEYEDLGDKIRVFLAQYSNNPMDSYQTQYDKLRDTFYKRKGLIEERDNKRNALDEYIKLYNLTEESYDTVDLDKINERLNAIADELKLITEKRTIKNSKVKDYEDELNKLDELKEKQASLEDEIKELSRSERIASLTLDYLAKANESLAAKYVKPMKDALEKYINLALGNDDIKFEIDINFNVYIMEDGYAKKLVYYSRGYQEIISLCMRLALVDVLYPNEKPFMVLDDPFVDYDDNHLNLAKSLLKKLSDEYQIIYYTCHESRSI